MREFQFYIVPTPIGNIADITLRAIDVLKSVDIIACEDSRVTQKLLNHYDIKTKCISYHKYNEKERVGLFLSYLNDGKTIALVSDAGTPMICDPGSVLLKELRDNNITVTSLAGASAVTTFLSLIPREGEEFAFIGFMPKTPSKINELIQKYKSTDMVFYESPNRILKTIEIIRDARPDAKIAVGRELTKVFEEIRIDDFENLNPKGEFVGMVFKSEITDDIDIDEKIKLLKMKNFKAKEISTILASLYDLNKNDIYKRII